MNVKKVVIEFLRAGKPVFPAERSLQRFFPYIFQSLLFGGLIGFSLIYQALIRIRVALYRWKICRQSLLPCPVISVGNITTGGTGVMKGKFDDVPLKRGKSLFIPACLGGYELVNTGSDKLEVVFCYPPAL